MPPPESNTTKPTKKQASEARYVEPHRWSPTAAYIGVLVTIALAIPSDIDPSFLVGLLCPPVVIIRVAVQLVPAGELSTLSILIFVAVSAAGNAFWYTLLAETSRLAFERLRANGSR
jgi:hypothetical protein